MRTLLDFSLPSANVGWLSPVAFSKIRDISQRIGMAFFPPLKDPHHIVV